MDKKTADKVVGWIKNTMLDAKVISKHFVLSKKDTKLVEELTKKIRVKMHPDLHKLYYKEEE